MQHSACGGLREAACSPSGMVSGRWNTHRLSRESTASPPTCPVTHLFGNACDHSGSGSKSGTCDRFVCPITYGSVNNAAVTTTASSAQAFLLISLLGMLRYLH